ncbi:MAG: monogalactosyldiacylglycerol synthase family protein [Xanthobacteraceae bacterium]|nr:MAG: monogalactosyldiacylglycerol synthase family protein [Xanthobacteraceae bacterium]
MEGIIRRGNPPASPSALRQVRQPGGDLRLTASPPSTSPAPHAPSAQPLHILVLMSRTGGGHLASARALEAEFQAQRPGCRVTIVDLLTDHIAFPFSRMPRGYDTLVGRAPRLWHTMWRMTAIAPVARSSAAIVRRMSRTHIEALLREARPDLVVSVHPLVNHLVIPVLERVAPRTRYVTVVTDLGGIHPSWLHPRNAAIYLPTERAVELAAARGLPRQRLHAHGLPVRADFARTAAERSDTCRAFGLDPDLPAVLVMGGGGGIGPMESIVSETAAALSAASPARPAAQIVVVCASNARLKERLAAATWPVPVTALGYVDRMSDLMQACDLLVTKAGPGTIAEASIRGLPMLLYGFIPGQEGANVDHVVDAGAGLFEPRVEALARTAAGLLTLDVDRRTAMAEKARSLGRARATHDIVTSILTEVLAR